MASPPLEQLPEALSGHVGYLIVRLGKHAQRLFSQQIEPLGLRPPHADILFVLADRGALAQVEISAALTIERAHLVALLDQLEAPGLVRRTPDPHDRRRHAVLLTEDGAAMASRLSDIARRVELALLAPLPEADRDGLRAALRLLARDADEGD